MYIHGTVTQVTLLGFRHVGADLCGIAFPDDEVKLLDEVQRSSRNASATLYVIHHTLYVIRIRYTLYEIRYMEYGIRNTKFTKISKKH